MKVSLEVKGDDALVARLQSFPDRLRKELTATIKQQAFDLQGYIQNNKLSGQVLNARTGTLRRSISSQITSTDAGVTGIVHSRAGGSPVAYAAIHEYGGIIHHPARDRELYRKLDATGSFFLRSGQFVKKRESNFVHTAKDKTGGKGYDIKMPERSYMRTSLAENKDKISQAISDAVTRAAGE